MNLKTVYKKEIITQNQIVIEDYFMLVNNLTATQAIQTQRQGGQVPPDYIKCFEFLPEIS